MNVTEYLPEAKALAPELRIQIEEAMVSYALDVLHDRKLQAEAFNYKEIGTPKVVESETELLDI